MGELRRLAGLGLLSMCLIVPSLGQDSCPALQVPQVIPGTNLFNPQQEVLLGDSIAGGIQARVHVFRDPALSAPLTSIVHRLWPYLPAGQPEPRVLVFDSPSADAFSIPGRIYISRKMVAFTRNEDEMAGVLAHEMGHLVAHHSAIELSERFRRVLAISTVGDQADIFALWNQYLNNYRRQQVRSGDIFKAVKQEEREQVQADTVALYLVSRAGYSSQSFVDVFDRLAGTRGNTGSFWSDLFGTTNTDSKRLRELVKSKAPITKACQAPHMEIVADFSKWRSSVIEYAEAAGTASLPGLVSKRSLTERLRPEIQNIRFSPDGNYVLAQDDSNIFVLSHSPLRTLFRIDAPDAAPAHFTPDSRSIAFHISALEASPRVERWDIATQKRIEVREIFVRKGCLSSSLSPDGRTLACMLNASSESQMAFDLKLFDTATGEAFFEKKNWVEMSPQRFDRFTLMKILFAIALGNDKIFNDLSPLVFSADSRYLIGRTPENVLLMDLNSRTSLQVPGSVRSLLELGSFTFLDNGRFMGVAGSRGDKSQIVEIPSGRVLEKDIVIGGSRIAGVARGDFILMRPIKDSPLGVYDLKQHKIVLGSKRNAVDVWNDTYIAERSDGDLQIYSLKTLEDVDHTELPQAPLGRLQAATLAPDLSWLAVSQSSRGAVWNLNTGQRAYHVRGFLGGYFGSDDALYVDFPKFLQTERTLVRVQLKAPVLEPKFTIPETEHVTQVGNYVLKIVPSTTNLYENVTMEIRDLAAQKVVWSRHFPQERPGYFVDTSTNTLVLYWHAQSKAMRTITREDTEAASKLAAFHDKEGIDYIEVLDLDTGKRRGSMAVDTGKNSFHPHDITAAGDRLVLADDKNRVLVYSLAGQQQATIVGIYPEIAPKSQLLSVRTDRSVLTLYELSTLKQRAVYDFGARIAFNGFSADGKRLLVLTADQTVYVLDTTAANDTKEVAQTKGATN